MLQGHDVLVQSATGSGKTLCYLVPLLDQLARLTLERHQQTEKAESWRDEGLLTLILAPTRELALQIQSVTSTMLRCLPWLVCSLLCGGEKRKSEKARLRKGCNLLIATPGRCYDHLLHTNSWRVDQCRHVVMLVAFG